MGIPIFCNQQEIIKNKRRDLMKAVILAAGVASRLRPLTNDTPKCLLKVGDKSILERTIDNLIKNKISDVIVVTGFLKTMIEERPISKLSSF